jgi:hypothetical protein
MKAKLKHYKNIKKKSKNKRYGLNTEQCLGCRKNSNFSVVATI